jgi:serine/threonine protein kinase
LSRGGAAAYAGYMPKQQLNFKYSKPEVDVWAMIASLYNMLTGKVPRVFPKGRDPFLVVLQDAAVPIRERDSKIPTKLAKVIDEALVDNPNLTFKTTADFKRALEDVVEGHVQ